MLGCERAGDVRRKQPASLDQDLAEPLVLLLLLGKRGVELLRLQQLALQQHGAEMRPRLVVEEDVVEPRRHC